MAEGMKSCMTRPLKEHGQPKPIAAHFLGPPGEVKTKARRASARTTKRRLSATRNVSGRVTGRGALCLPSQRPAGRRRHCRKDLVDDGRSFGSYIDQAVCPQTELFLYLKKRSVVVHHAGGHLRVRKRRRRLQKSGVFEQVRRGLVDHWATTEFAHYGASQLGGQRSDVIGL